MPPPVFRFAPSPNGYLHLGHAYSALLNANLARQANGRLLLRIEDIDATRCRPEFEAAIYEDLHWLGLAWETPVRRQSDHFASYRAALDRLSARGLIYQSFESRAEIARMVAERDANTPWPRDPDGAPLYPGTAKQLSAREREALMKSGAPCALRLDMAAALASAGDLDWTEEGEGPGGEDGRVRAAGSGRSRRRGAMSSSAARTPRRAIILPWWWTMRCRGSRTWCGDRICSGPPACIAYCSDCSTCPHHATATMPWCGMPPARNCPNRPGRPVCGSCGPKAFRRPWCGGA